MCVFLVWKLRLIQFSTLAQRITQYKNCFLEEERKTILQEKGWIDFLIMKSDD